MAVLRCGWVRLHLPTDLRLKTPCRGVVRQAVLVKVYRACHPARQFLFDKASRRAAQLTLDPDLRVNSRQQDVPGISASPGPPPTFTSWKQVAQITAKMYSSRHDVSLQHVGNG